MTEEATDLAPSFADPKARMAYARSFQKNRKIPSREPKPVPEALTEKVIYDETLEQVWTIITDPKVGLEDKRPYHMAILRWQGKLDAVDSKHLEELKKLMEKRSA